MDERMFWYTNPGDSMGKAGFSCSTLPFSVGGLKHRMKNLKYPCRQRFLSSNNLSHKVEMDLFRLCPIQYVMLPPVKEHVSLRGKPLCKNNMARESEGVQKICTH